LRAGEERRREEKRGGAEWRAAKTVPREDVFGDIMITNITKQLNTTYSG